MNSANHSTIVSKRKKQISGVAAALPRSQFDKAVCLSLITPKSISRRNDPLTTLRTNRNLQPSSAQLHSPFDHGLTSARMPAHIVSNNNDHCNN